MKKVLAFILALAMVFALAACGNKNSGGSNSGTSTKKYTIGISEQGTNNSWAASADAHFKYVLEGYKDQTQNVYYAECGYDSQKQIADIEDLLTKNIDGLIVQSTSETALAGVIDKAHSQGVKVVIYNGAVGTDTYDSSVTRDQQITGSDYAQYVCDRLGGKGNVLVIMGYPGSGYSNDVLAGVQSVLDKNSGITVLGTEYAEYTPDKAKQIVEGYFAKGAQIDGVIVDGGLMGYGVLEAFTDAGKTIPPMTCDDTFLFLKKAVSLNFTDYICLSSGAELAKQCVDTMFNILNGQSVQKDYAIAPETVTGQDVLSKVDTTLPDSYWYFSKIPADRIAEFYK